MYVASCRQGAVPELSSACFDLCIHQPASGEKTCVRVVLARLRARLPLLCRAAARQLPRCCGGGCLLWLWARGRVRHCREWSWRRSVGRSVGRQRAACTPGCMMQCACGVLLHPLTYRSACCLSSATSNHHNCMAPATLGRCTGQPAQGQAGTQRRAARRGTDWLLLLLWACGAAAAQQAGRQAGLGQGNRGCCSRASGL